MDVPESHRVNTTLTAAKRNFLKVKPLSGHLSLVKYMQSCYTWGT